MTIQDGWMPGVETVPTAAFGHAAVPTGQMWPKQIINHIMQGYQNTMIQWAKERPVKTRASAHFSINRAGRIVQHVSLWDPAWHVAASDWNAHSIGIEHEGFSVPPGYGYDYVYGPANPWPEAMIEATIRVQKWVFEAIRAYDPSVEPNEGSILTHSMVQPADRKDDPGAYFIATVLPRIVRETREHIFPPAPEPPAVNAAEVYMEGVTAGRKEMLDQAIAALEALR